MILNKSGVQSAMDGATGLGCQLDAFYTILEKKIINDDKYCPLVDCFHRMEPT